MFAFVCLFVVLFCFLFVCFVLFVCFFVVVVGFVLLLLLLLFSSCELNTVQYFIENMWTLQMDKQSRVTRYFHKNKNLLNIGLRPKIQSIQDCQKSTLKQLILSQYTVFENFSFLSYRHYCLTEI